MRRMLEALTFGDFSGRVGEEFRLEGPSGAVPLTLVEVVNLAGRENAGPRRSPFSLIFRGPAAPLVPQRTWPITHETLGRLEIFLVPIGPDASGMRYEAIFN